MFCFLTLALTLLVLTAGAGPEPAAEAQGTVGMRTEPVDRLPADGMTREELVGLYQTLGGAPSQPPACVPDEEMFTDVPASNVFCPWIEELARRGITEDCTDTEYCPTQPVTRAQMAAFLIKTNEACPTRDPSDETIRVGGVCIDKYEASIWDAPVGGNRITDTIPCNPNGQDCDNIYTRSVAGVEPRSFITWFQAQAALASSGKRLPTNAEWQMAVRGTSDDTQCNINLGAPVETGSHPGCVSDWGAFDMVGNLAEWTADWDEASVGCQNWASTHGDDVSCIGRMDGDADLHLPGAFLRGGHWGDGTTAGAVSLITSNVPSVAGAVEGFRGAR